MATVFPHPIARHFSVKSMSNYYHYSLVLSTRIQPISTISKLNRKSSDQYQYQYWSQNSCYCSPWYLFFLHLVIEVTSPAVRVAHSCTHNYKADDFKDDAYPHYYTGAFINPGYPARSEGRSGDGQYMMYFGGQPPYTYTTLTLHSSPSLFSDGGFYIKNGTHWDFTGFSEEVYSPVSIFNAESECIWLYSWSGNLWPAFLLSFQGIWH